MIFAILGSFQKYFFTKIFHIGVGAGKEGGGGLRLIGYPIFDCLNLLKILICQKVYSTVHLYAGRSC